jgi:predicted ATPase
MMSEPTAFVGRRREISEARRLLQRTRLLTLTGAGGVGKTRLAGRVAVSVRGRFPGGVVFLELAALEESDLLETALATKLGLSDTGQALMDYLADRRMLIVLDNCEHLLQACADLVNRLLRGAPRLSVLTTSRQPLGVAGEQLLPVPALPVPEPGANVSGIARCEAVRLFIERAAEAQPGFSVDAANAPTVARLSRRLGGIPLAIELAAVRLRTTPVETLARELEDRLDILTGGSPTALPRHQTLWATIAWSYELCTPGEQRLWSRLSVFPGGADLETVEAICSGDGIDRDDVLDLVAGLVDKSVLVGIRVGTGVRHTMLDSIRTYGRERLTQADAETLRRRYRDHYRRLADGNRIDRFVPDQLDRFNLLRTELPNIRLALDLCFRPNGDATAGLEIASALGAYWLMAGSLTEGRHWLDRGLKLVPEDDPGRAIALWSDALLATHQGDYAAVTPLLNESMALAEKTGDRSVMAYAEQASGVFALATGDSHHGFALMEDARSRHEAIGDVAAVGANLYYSAIFGATEDPARAAALGSQLLAISDVYDAPVFRSYAQLARGYAACRQRDWQTAEAALLDVIGIMGNVDDRWWLTQCMEMLAWTAGLQGQHERAAALLGAASELWHSLDSSPAGLRFNLRSHERCIEESRGALGAQTFRTVFRKGARMPLDQAVAYAIGSAN